MEIFWNGILGGIYYKDLNSGFNGLCEIIAWMNVVGNINSIV